MRIILYYPVCALIWVWELFFSIFTWILERPIIALSRRIIARANVQLIEKIEGEAELEKTVINPWDVQILDRRFYRRMINGGGGKGLLNAYVDGLWTCERPDEFSYQVMKHGVFRLSNNLPWNRLIHYFKYEFFNLQTAKRAFQVGKQHYDLGNELFESFLDKNLNYSCGYWKDARDLDEAQLHKMELIARKLHLKPGMRVLDIGCGWGNLCKFLAEKYKVSVVGATISVEQAKLARERCEGLPVDIRVVDYRQIDEKFDRVVSVGMFEHVGKQNYGKFFKVAHRCLDDGGIFLLHSIGIGSPIFPTTDPWICDNIFPNGRLPYHTEIPGEVDGLFLIEDWHNFGPDYDKTLMAWHANFVQNWPTIKHLYQDPERFYRLWSLYLLICAGSFRSRGIQLWQIVLSKNGVEGGYNSVR